MKVCSICGSSYEQIVKSQKIGCAECYYTFEEEFTDTLKKNNIIGDYKGSLPKHLKGYKSTIVNRVEMQLKLDEAVANEEYEKAALYRDYLKVLNSQKIVSGEDCDEAGKSKNASVDSDQALADSDKDPGTSDKTPGDSDGQ